LISLNNPEQIGSDLGARLGDATMEPSDLALSSPRGQEALFDGTINEGLGLLKEVLGRLGIRGLDGLKQLLDGRTDLRELALILLLALDALAMPLNGAQMAPWA
jgi:hypothetical protein